ncbi:hypothetical protein [Micromonospora craniellae]|uniref:hypothetical protein n=1 Tax=Micromonospora craniellae TaxID=2294034 RepID=UPI00168BEF5B|nr:hypothetical protein [Micromonospora craniellae]QOC91401.1 hypothetical protein ID554_26055 [Micromonospora craniellae]
MTATLRRGLVALVGTTFGWAVLACLVLAGWALWSAGVLDGPIARQVRAASVYVAPGVDLDQPAAERIIGNRRLVVLVMAAGDDLRAACDRTRQAAKGTLVLAMSRDGDDWDTYGCSRIAQRDSKDFGRAMVAETIISRGVDSFVDQPLEALKVVVVNYDLLVRAGTVPDGARTISPSLPRYLLAGAAVGGVVAGAASLWFAGRRAARLAADRRRRRDEQADERSALSAAAAGLAQQIVDLDKRYGQLSARSTGRGYARLVGDYTRLLVELSAAGEADSTVRRLRERVDELSTRATMLTREAEARTGGGSGSGGSRATDHRPASRRGDRRGRRRDRPGSTAG